MKNAIVVVEVSDDEQQAILRGEEKGFLSRGTAASVFERVADLGESGHWPEEITPFMVGRALSRLGSNSGLELEEFERELLRGLKNT